jgi:hypothetical protein
MTTETSPVTAAWSTIVKDGKFNLYKRMSSSLFSRLINRAAGESYETWRESVSKFPCFQEVKCIIDYIAALARANLINPNRKEIK